MRCVLANLRQIKAGLKTRLETVALTAELSNTRQLKVYDLVPETVITPCAIIIPKSSEWNQTYQRGTDAYTFEIQLLAAKADSATGQELLDRFLEAGGVSSILDAIDADDTLGGLVHYTNFSGWDDYGKYDYPPVSYWGVVLKVEVLASV
jgi:hypothetical protein